MSEHLPTNRTFNLLYIDPFWETTECDTVEAPDLASAIEFAPPVSEKGWPLCGVVVIGAPPGHPDDREPVMVELLGEDSCGDLILEEVPALCAGMAIELAFVVAGDEGAVHAIRADGVVLRHEDAPEEFWQRPDLPDGWVED